MAVETDEKVIKEAEQNLARVKSQPNPDPDLVKWYERRIETLKKSAIGVGGCIRSRRSACEYPHYFKGESKCYMKSLAMTKITVFHTLNPVVIHRVLRNVCIPNAPLKTGS